MQWRSEAFWLPKAGNSAREFEDSFHPPDLCDGIERQGDRFRCAVADGASESVFADIWAKLLVRGYTRGQFSFTTVEDDITRLQSRFAKITSRQSVNWYAEQKLAMGTFATFIGLEVVDCTDRIRSWSSFALGDSCLFLIRQDSLLFSYPLSTSGDFTRSPELVCSNRSNRGFTKSIRCESGSWEPGDKFLLMTDALAAWFLSECEVGNKPWDALNISFGRTEFPDFVSDQRRQNKLRNDDVTLVRIAVT
jgi:hypothetical protein